MSTFAAWILTYALHSTLLLGLAWALARPLGRRSPRLEEAAWRGALLGAVATATLHLAAAGAGWTPALGSWRLAAPAVAVAAPAVPAPGAGPALEPVATSGSAPAWSVPLAVSGAAASAVPAPGEAAPARGRELPGGLAWLALLWAAGALALLARFALAHLGLRHRLRPRLEISGGTLYRLLARLAPQSGLARPVELTCAYRLPVPVALGVRRPEICVPPRALSHLDAAAQETLLAHELGHLARRDPLWLNAVSLLCCTLFFQPLNWLARRRLREISELLCDDWAVRRTGQPLTLARCLAEVAGWSHGLSGALLPAPGMADRPSQLSRRVRRLLDAPGGLAADRAERALPRWLGAALVIVLAAVAAVAPGVSAAARDQAAPAVPEAGRAAPAPQASAAAPPAAPAPHPVLAPVPRGLSAEGRERIRVFRERVEELSERQDLSAEEIERQAEALAEELERDLQPHIDEMTAHVAALAESGELHRFTADAEALAARLAPLTAELERLIPSDEELERLIPSDAELERLIPSDEELERMIPSDAEIEAIVAGALARSAADVDRLKALATQLEANGLSREEVERIRQEALRAAEGARLDAAAQADLRRLAEEMRDFERTHRHEIEQLRRDLLERSHGLSEEIRREVERELAPMPPPPPPARAPAPPPAPAPAPAPGVAPVPAPPAPAAPALTPAPAPPARPAKVAAAPRPAPPPPVPAPPAPPREEAPPHR